MLRAKQRKQVGGSDLKILKQSQRSQSEFGRQAGEVTQWLQKDIGLEAEQDVAWTKSQETKNILKKSIKVYKRFQCFFALVKYFSSGYGMFVHH